MPIAKATCPECGAKLSSPEGFDIGEEVECPKCETEFKVRAPKPAAAPAKPAAKPKIVEDDDEEEERPRSKSKKPAPKPVDDDDEDDEDFEDERPKKKKKKGSRRDDEEKSYKSSPIRFIILGVLVLITFVGGFFLVRKIMAERAAAAEVQPAGTSLARTASQTSAMTLVAVA